MTRSTATAHPPDGAATAGRLEPLQPLLSRTPPQRERALVCPPVTIPAGFFFAFSVRKVIGRTGPPATIPVSALSPFAVLVAGVFIPAS